MIMNWIRITLAKWPSANQNVTLVPKGLWNSENELLFTYNATNSAESSLIYSATSIEEYHVLVFHLTIILRIRNTANRHLSLK